MVKNSAPDNQDNLPGAAWESPATARRERRVQETLAETNRIRAEKGLEPLDLGSEVDGARIERFLIGALVVMVIGLLIWMNT